MKNLLIVLFSILVSVQSFAKDEEQPYAMTPDALPKTSASLKDGQSSESSVADLQKGGAALYTIINAIDNVATGVQMVKHSKGLSKELRGECIYGEPEKEFAASPCIRVQVRLLDDSKKIAATSETNEKGQFRFYIPEDKKYFVEIEDRKSRKANTPRAVGRGDIATIYLKP